MIEHYRLSPNRTMEGYVIPFHVESHSYCERNIAAGNMRIIDVYNDAHEGSISTGFLAPDPFDAITGDILKCNDIFFMRRNGFYHKAYRRYTAARIRHDAECRAGELGVITGSSTSCVDMVFQDGSGKIDFSEIDISSPPTSDERVWLTMEILGGRIPEWH